MDKVYQIFVSSTFSDLEHERRQVTNTLAKAGYLAAGMELFSATDQQQLDFIKRVIDRSDYYVVIVAGRYGSLADDKLSFTEHEYEYALSKGISGWISAASVDAALLNAAAAFSPAAPWRPRSTR
jgi:hypothetical protein